MPSFTRSSAALLVVLFASAGCPNGNVGGSGGTAGSGGAAGNGGSAGSGGSQGGNGGSQGGSGGAQGGSGGAEGGSAGSGGATGGNGGSAAGSGGSIGGAGGFAGSGGGGPGGAGGSSGGGGAQQMAVPECTQDADCKVVNDCCNCLGIPANDPAPPCPIQNCFVPTCTAMGNSNAVAKCVAGQCIPNFICDAPVVCAQPPPPCAAGQVPSITNGCWGACVPTEECLTVPKCTQCTGTQTCVEYVTQLGPQFHCVPTPAVCPTEECACMADAVCQGSFNLCSDGGMGEISCDCPVC